jgi:uncharacterized protein (DUF433 family)
MDAKELLGIGIYSVPEAARLIHAPEASVRRWLHGYRRRDSKGHRHHVDRIWRGDLERLDATTALSFLDLIEAKIVRAFTLAGVSWNVVREVHHQAEKELGHPHPFSTNWFVTDGHEIFRELENFGLPRGLDSVKTRQGCFQEIVRPTLIELEFDRNAARRWWPLGLARPTVVLDPHRAFGRPIVSNEGVPTEILAAAMAAGNSHQEVIRWYEVAPKSLRDAVEFEASHAA